MPNFSGSRTTFGGKPGGVTGKGKNGGRTGRGGSLDKYRAASPTFQDSMVFSGEQQKMLLEKDYKPTEKGSKAGNVNKKPLEDNIAHSQTLLSSKPLTDVEKAVLEARRQRNELDTGLDVAQGILGLMPSNLPMGAGFALGRWMGKQTEEDASQNPDKYRTDPKDPGSLYSKGGPVSTNRAIDLPSNKKNTSNAAGETLKKKKQQLPTLLGASANPLGTFSNPIMIT